MSIFLTLSFSKFRSTYSHCPLIHKQLSKEILGTVWAETFLFTRETIRSQCSYIFLSERDTAGFPVMIWIKFLWFWVHFWSKRSGQNLLVYPPMKAAWKPQMQPGWAGESREQGACEAPLYTTCFLQTEASLSSHMVWKGDGANIIWANMMKESE